MSLRWRDADTERRQLGLAMEDCARAIHLKPDYAEAYDNRGRVYMQQRQFTAAITDFNEAIRLDPKPVQAIANRGFALEATGRPDIALKDYQRAHQLGLRHPLLMERLRALGGN